MYDEGRDNPLSPPPSSMCPSTGCIPCLGEPTSYPYIYQPGDIIINGVFSAHFPGTEAVRCGAFFGDSRSGTLMSEAMIYAIQQVNSKGILKNVRLGGLGFDDCMSPVLGKLLVTEVHQHRRTIVDSSKNDILNPNTIDAYMGAEDLFNTLPLASLMNDLKRPLLGYFASSTKLQEYPYYRYVFPSSYYTLKAVVLMLKRLGWNYVQVVQSNNEYHDIVFKDFKMLAAEEGICVVSRFSFWEDGDMMDVFNNLKHDMNVRPVFILANSTDLRSFLTTVKTNNGSGMFHFFSHLTENQHLTGIEDIADGLWTVHADPLDMSGFIQHLSGLQPLTYTTNPWFKELYEHAYSCSLDTSNMRSYQTVCADSNLNPITNKLNTNAVTQAVFPVVAAVHAAAYAIDETLKHYCGTGYSGICSNFQTAANKGQVLLQKLDEVTFEVESGKIFRMKDKSANFLINYHNFKNGGFVEVTISSF